MTLSPFPAAAPDFSDPLGLLRACHQRIFDHCRTLERLVPYLAEHGADTEAREAMARIYRYFTVAAPHHHADEEEDLFPGLMTAAPEMKPLVDELLADHALLASRWAALAVLLADPERAEAEKDVFAHVVAEFVTAYRGHAEKENERLLPRAAQALSNEQKQALGAAMAARRKASLPPNS